MGSYMPCCQEDQKENSHPSTPVAVATIPSPSRSQLLSVNSDIVPTPRPLNIRAQVEIAPRRDKQDRSPENYQSVKVLGKGSFGYVVLVEEKVTKRRFAMKMIPKTKINEQNLLQTKLIQSIRKHPFLTNIHQTFQNKQNIYIVMEYLPKGDLYFYIHKQGTVLSETTIRDILAEIIIGIEYLHKHGIVYRELKPENILVTDQGHIKLTDYGLSKLIAEDSLQRGISTFMGAVEYMAPEAISGQYDQKADIWALGMVTYQLKFMENPLEHDRPSTKSIAQYESLLKNNFLRQKINSKIGYMTHEFRQLLLRLLDIDPHTRISLEQLRNHPFFEGVNWNEVEARTNIGPLLEVIQKNDLIKFRDPTAEQSKRQDVFKRNPEGNKKKFSLNLFEVRISQ